MTAAIKPILKYPGAKWAMAEWILSYLPTHTHYCEPYFGSGAVFFNKKPAKHEVINDMNGDVVNLFRVIRERGRELSEWVAATPWARFEYEISTDPVADELERARRFVVRCWMAHGAKLSNKPGWCHQGVSLPYTSVVTKWQRVPASILACFDRLLGVEIENRPALDIVARHFSPDVLLYVDPPYPLSTRNGTLYAHEMTDADHAALLDALDAHPGPVVLSGYHCQLYDERLKAWHTREKKVQAEKGNTRTEVLWLNPVCVERLGYGPLFSGGPLPSAGEGNG